MDVALTTGLLAVASTDLFCDVIFQLWGKPSNVRTEREGGSNPGQIRQILWGHISIWWRVPSTPQAGIRQPQVAATNPDSWYQDTRILRMPGRQSGTVLAGSAEKSTPDRKSAGAGCLHLISGPTINKRRANRPAMSKRRVAIRLTDTAAVGSEGTPSHSPIVHLAGLFLTNGALYLVIFLPAERRCAGNQARATNAMKTRSKQQRGPGLPAAHGSASDWKPDYKVTPRRVVCAALRNRTSGRIICGARHWDKVMRAQKLENESWKGWDQGFIDQFGDWMDRETAWRIACDQMQIRRLVGPSGTLFSENLY